VSDRKTAIITGASGGIGAGLVEEFLREGYNVVATSRGANRDWTTSGSLVLLDGDIGKQQTAAQAVEAAINNFGTIDVLVNNAGIFVLSSQESFVRYIRRTRIARACCLKRVLCGTANEVPSA
jgi:NAD(P)-dependent dehydrogenase (short-subunit alcohol dehydrogenase family)